MCFGAKQNPVPAKSPTAMPAPADPVVGDNPVDPLPDNYDRPDAKPDTQARTTGGVTGLNIPL